MTFIETALAVLAGPGGDRSRRGRLSPATRQPDQAAALLGEGIAQLGTPFVRDQQIYQTRLAEALARPGKQRNLDTAAGLGMQSIDLAESLESHTGADHLRDLYYQLRPYAKVPAAQDFVERARGFVEGR